MPIVHVKNYSSFSQVLLEHEDAVHKPGEPHVWMTILLSLFPRIPIQWKLLINHEKIHNSTFSLLLPLGGQANPTSTTSSHN